MSNAQERINHIINAKIKHDKTTVNNARWQCVDVAKKLGLTFHGGFAINNCLSSKNKLFDDTDIPDIDTMSSKNNNSKKTAFVVADELRKRGIKQVRVLQAIHQHTYSVRMDRTVLIDISHIKQSEMNSLNSIAKIEGVYEKRSVPPSYLKMSMHLELCRPKMFVERWKKIYPRLTAIYQDYPSLIKDYTISSDLILTEPEPNPIREAFHTLDFNKHFCLVGSDSVHALTGKWYLRDWPVDMMFHQDDIRDADSFVNGLIHTLDLDYPAHKTKETLFLPEYYLLSKNGAYVGRVFVTNTEVSTAKKEDEGPVFGSTDLVLQLLYGQYLKNYTADKDTKDRIISSINDLVCIQYTASCDAGLTRRFSSVDSV
ncbi:hypothetical protein TetV_660 [Tetraselmis virus 1]|uniref:Putative poly(A) polymerase catalytic subunit n=1 Tax=Tetraselmis virus 1 TaxID=2060617 RepID=A0A2P0VPD5_9VIRU|nr:hypothetical protein QJ968_gp394 [Tetraselmis virus 1]AUF82742.1 hypothetical protein TetV_660 [Tetraselmis virus 1]